MSRERGLALLDGDVLFQLLEELLRQKCLHLLSASCRSLRNAALPILFRYCEILLFRERVDVHRFPPSSLWPYFQHISLVDECPDYDTERPPWDPADGEVFGPGFLTEAFPRMPRLNELSFSSPFPTIRNLPWTTIKALVTLPQLRRLNIKGPLLGVGACDRVLYDADLQSSRLSCLVYSPWDTRDPPRSHVCEQYALVAVLGALAGSLEKLDLPNESAPLHLIQAAHWHNLRQLRLRGEVQHPLAGVAEPYVALLGNMPRLRSLSLEVFFPLGSHISAIWPLGFDAVYPWPDLESLTLSHPQVDDQLYRHLPPTLRRLELCCSPYHHHYVWGSMGPAHREEWQDPLLTSSQMLRILRQCRTGELTELTMQFFADSAEMELFRFLPDAFPHLCSLTVHVYRSDCEHEEVPVKPIALALSPLTRLRTLRLHLGFRGVQGEFGYWGEKLDGVWSPDHDLLDRTVDSAAQILANTLPSSLEVLDLYLPTEARPNEYQLEFEQGILEVISCY
ncbi:hypothetical protein BV20DRAFT_729235 [Pilatotrama ljubarskyi]|nr:hypothetical protein BV20DRAFT_729235 [Pilatotrama ljubarskyi]